MQRIERAAEIVVGRGMSFTLLAVVTLCVGMSFDPAKALATAALSLGLVACLLVLMARGAPARPYRRSEVFDLLDRKLDLPEPVAQKLISQALVSAYHRHARWTSAAAAGCAMGWMVALIASQAS